MHVAELPPLLGELDFADNSSVMVSPDSDPHFNIWPMAGYARFRNEKNWNWEGAFRVPAFVRWPGRFPAGETLNGRIGKEVTPHAVRVLPPHPDSAEPQRLRERAPGQPQGLGPTIRTQPQRQTRSGRPGLDRRHEPTRPNAACRSTAEMQVCASNACGTRPRDTHNAGRPANRVGGNGTQHPRPCTRTTRRNGINSAISEHPGDTSTNHPRNGTSNTATGTRARRRNSAATSSPTAAGTSKTSNSTPHHTPIPYGRCDHHSRAIATSRGLMFAATRAPPGLNATTGHPACTYSTAAVTSGLRSATSGGPASPHVTTLSGA